KLIGPAGPLRSRPRERHTIDRNGPVSNGHPSAPIHPIASQPRKQTRTTPAQHQQHHIAPQPLARHANPFASLAESLADSTPLASGIASPPATQQSRTSIRFARAKPIPHTYVTTQPLNTRSATTIPKRGCMRVLPTVADATSVQAVTGQGPARPLVQFRSLLPQGPPRATPFVRPASHHIFTIFHASAGPHGGVLFRVDAMVHGHRVRCLIDCGASSDFISIDFLRRHGLEKSLLPSQHHVRGYDGQLTPAAGVIAAPVTLAALGGTAKEAPVLQLLAAQLHSDDAILGLPWLTATGAVIDVGARSVALNHGGGRHTISLGVAFPQKPAAVAAPTAAARLMESVLTLYSAELDDDNHVSHGALATMLR
ncbi:retroviral-like aspartic protease family protein, partial [Dyella sp.]|uniref:retropepsin-like aspartic protease n=1 Tax=Dyella sp. TaxID=1869338 RepID=UPI00285145F7